MSPAAIQHQVLEDLRKLPARLQQQLLELVHAMVLSIRQQDLLRLEVDDPRKAPQPPAVSSEDLPPDAGPAAVLDELRRQIADGQVLQARRLAALGAERFPEDQDIRKAHRILNGGKSVVGTGGPEPSMDQELEWLGDPPGWARGKWVGLIGKKTVASAVSLAELAATVKEMDLPRAPLVHSID